MSLFDDLYYGNINMQMALTKKLLLKLLSLPRTRFPSSCPST